MSPAIRSIISRGTLLLMAIALIYAGAICIGKAREVHQDELRRHALQPNPRAKMNGGYLYIGAIGVVLILGGSLAAFGAVAPTGLVERILGRPPNVTLHENPEPGSVNRF